MPFGVLIDLRFCTVPDCFFDTLKPTYGLDHRSVSLFYGCPPKAAGLILYDQIRYSRFPFSRVMASISSTGISLISASFSAIR